MSTTSDDADAAISNLYVQQSGAPRGLPTIVLEAGAGATSASWGWVQKRLAERALVVSYDRAGLGKSDVRRADVGAQAAVTRLESLLGFLRLTPPYVLVGHSFGGLLVQHYAALRPETTAALVLVDPTPADASLYPRGHDRLAPLYFAFLRLLQGIAWTGALRVYNPLARFAQRSGLPPCDATDMIAALASPRHLGTVIRELKAMTAVQDAVHTHPVPEHVPVLVIGAEVRMRAAVPAGSVHARFYDAVLQDHRSMAKRAAFGQHVVIQNADHNTLLTQQSFADELADHIVRFAAHVARM